MNDIENIRSILVCVICGGELDFCHRDRIVCKRCEKIYPVKNEIPILIEEERNEYKYELPWHSVFLPERRVLIGKIIDVLKRMGLKNIIDFARHPFFIDTKKRIKKLLREDTFVLDLGCRDSKYTRDLSNDVVGIDIDFDSLNVAKRYGKKNFYPILSQAEKLPFRENLFDLVICTELLEHIEDDEKAVSNAANVLKSKGKFFITTPNGDVVKLEKDNKAHLRHYKVEELSKILNKYFDKVRIEGRFKFYRILQYKHKIEMRNAGGGNRALLILGGLLSLFHNTILLPLEKLFFRGMKGKYNLAAICSEPKRLL